MIDNIIELLEKSLNREFRFSTFSVVLDYTSSCTYSMDQSDNITAINLVGCNLTEIPSDVLKIKTLIGLNLCNNKIQSIPCGINNLQDLQYLYLSNNLIEELPNELFQLKNLLEISISRNKLKGVPKDICKLKKLRNFRIYNNNIESIPKEITELNIDIFWDESYESGVILYDNPIIEPPIEILKRGSNAVKNYFFEFTSPEISNNVSSSVQTINNFIKVPSGLKRIIKQTLQFFPEFELKIHRVNINLEVFSHENGIIISLAKPNNIDISIIQSHLQRFVMILTGQIDITTSEYRNTITDDSYDFFLMELKNHIQFLKNSLYQKEYQIKTYSKETKLLKEINLTLSRALDNFSTSGITVNLNLNINIKIQENIKKLDNDISRIIPILIRHNEQIANEIIDLKNKISKISSEEDLQKNKGLFKKLENILFKIGDDKTNLGKTFKGLHNISSLISPTIQTIGSLLEMIK